MNLRNAMSVRLIRNKLIDNLSKYGEAFNYEELTIEQKEELKTYIEELRNVPQSQFIIEGVNGAEDIIWPQKPEWVK